MRNRTRINNILTTNRKVLYIILSIVMISVLTLTVVYAALSTTLNINGNAEVSSASWDIHLDNVQLNSSSVTLTPPTISTKRTVSFTTTLSKPGDFYEFTIDVVNNGSIDAMIDSVAKTPELTAEQAKYLNYIVEYENGEPINYKQLVEKKSFVRLKVKLEFRNDITSTDLPITSETLNLNFTVNYVQVDNQETIPEDDEMEKNPYEIVKGNLNTVGSEVSIAEEHFYVISSDENSVTMLAKYNLEVGNICTSSSCTEISEPSKKQGSTIKGWVSGESKSNGTTAFSSTNYWYKGGLKKEYGTSYPAYVYDSNSTLYNYVENYKIYLESQGAKIEEARLIKIEELEALGCSRDSQSCNGAPSWVYATSYWSGTAYDHDGLWFVSSNDGSGGSFSDTNKSYGVRPVIKVLKSEF